MRPAAAGRGTKANTWLHFIICFAFGRLLLYFLDAVVRAALYGCAVITALQLTCVLLLQTCRFARTTLQVTNAYGVLPSAIVERTDRLLQSLCRRIHKVIFIFPEISSTRPRASTNIDQTIDEPRNNEQEEGGPVENEPVPSFPAWTFNDLFSYEPELRDCPICVESKTASTAFRNDAGLVLSCGHDRTVCQECIAAHIITQVRDHRNVFVRCMMPDCDDVYSVDYIRGLPFGAELAREVEQRRSANRLQHLPEFTWCARPDCGAGYIHVVGGRDGRTNAMMVCNACGAKTCAVHRVLWHEGLTCREYDHKVRPSIRKRIINKLKGKKSDGRNKDGTGGSGGINMIQMKIKTCPMCSQGVQKNGGCDHITCQASAGGCGAEFCWICLVDYNGPRGIRAIGNSAHLKSCRHYRR